MMQLIERINEKLQSQQFKSLAEAKTEISSSSAGFYWIYTQLPIERFLSCAPPTNQVHIDFRLLAQTHRGLNSVIKQVGQENWCIYNGKGKELKKRLSAGFTNTIGPTGKLALTRCFEEGDFRIKYITCDSNAEFHGISETYGDLEKDLERVWRLQYGWPLLCRT
jgi:hypothetical protein